MTKIIIMLLTNGFDPDIRTYKEASYLVRQGFQVTIFCWDRTCILPELQELDGIIIVRCHIQSQYGTGLKQLPAFFRFLFECRRYVSKTPHQYLHCVDLDAMVIGFLCNKHRRHKIIFDMREFNNSGSLAKFSFLVIPLVKMLQTYADHIIYVNPLQITARKANDTLRFVFLPNYPEKHKFDHIMHEPSPKLRIAYMGMVRRFSTLKTLLDECVSMQEQVEVQIHGSGIDEKRIRHYANEINYGIVSGRYAHSQIGVLYGNCDISFCVHLNDDENDRQAFPTKIFESIRALCPVMVQKGTLMAKFVLENDIGFCVDWTMKGSIKEAVKNIIANPEVLSQYRENMKKIRDCFSWEDVVKNLDNIYAAPDYRTINAR